MEPDEKAEPQQVRPFFRVLAALLALAFGFLLYSLVTKPLPKSFSAFELVVFSVIYFIPGLFFFLFAASGARMPKWFRKRFGESFQKKIVAFLEQWHAASRGK